jgi:hypothetical protein
MKKKEDINDYCSAGDAARLLSAKLGRPIRPDYISKMTRRKKEAIRCVQVSDRMLYHKADLAACSITRKNAQL